MNLPEPQLATRVRVMQIIALALLFGVLTLCGVSLAVVQVNGPLAPPPEGAPRVITMVAMALFAIDVPLSFFVPAALLRGAIQRIAATTPHGTDAEQSARDEAALLGMRQVTLIIGNALLEAVAMLGSIAYLLEGQGFVLLAVVIPVLLMLWRFPTVEGTRYWLERYAGLMAELRALGNELR
jgi:hypothetical protein